MCIDSVDMDYSADMNCSADLDYPADLDRFVVTVVALVLTVDY